MQRRKEEDRGPRVITISTGTILRTILIGLALVFLYIIRDVVALFLIALLVAAIIDPFGERLQRWGLPRGLAVFIVYIVGLAALVGVMVLVVPPTVAELHDLSVKFAPLIENTPFADVKNLVESGAWTQDLQGVITSVQETGLVSALPQLGVWAQNAVGGIFALLLVLVLAFYMVVEEHVVRRGVAAFAPAEYQPFVTQLSMKIREKVGAWLRGQLLVMLIVGILCYGALTILGVPYAIVLAALAALLEVVPFIGPNVAAVPAMVIAFGISPVHGVLVIAAYFVIQQLENHILVPKIMQKTTGLNPIVSILAILIGFQVDGIVGAMLSIPIAMVISVFYNEVFKTRDIAE